jgi:type I restriction enzyme, S subunit
MSIQRIKSPLSELCQLINRGNSPVYVEEGGLLVVNQRCIRDQHLSLAEARRTDTAKKAVSPDRILRPYDILVNSTGVGTLGRVAQVVDMAVQATVDSHVTIVRPDPSRISPRFLGFALRNSEAAIESLAEGSTGQTELARSRLSGLQLSIPPREHQRAIGDLLGSLDDKIQLNRRMKNTLDLAIRAIFNSWFIYFDSMKSEQSQCGPLLPDSIRLLFGDHMVDATCGTVPSKWESAQLADHVEVDRGLSYKGSGLCERGMPLHNLNSIYEGGGYKYEGIKYYDANFQRRHLVTPGDVIVANTEQGHERLLIGYAAVVPENFGSPSIFSHHLYRLRIKESSPITSQFLVHLLNSGPMHGVVSRYANGTTVNMLPREALRLPVFGLPPRELIQEFDRLARQIATRQEQIIAESRGLSALLRLIMPRLLAGEMVFG